MYISLCVYVYVYVCMCLCIYIYICLCAHTYTFAKWRLRIRIQSWIGATPWSVTSRSSRLHGFPGVPHLGTRAVNFQGLQRSFNREAWCLKCEYMSSSDVSECGCLGNCCRPVSKRMAKLISNSAQRLNSLERPNLGSFPTREAPKR